MSVFKFKDFSTMYKLESEHSIPFSEFKEKNKKFNDFIVGKWADVYGIEDDSKVVTVSKKLDTSTTLDNCVFDGTDGFLVHGSDDGFGNMLFILN